MNKKIITIVDYECGNIYSLLRILDKFGYKVELTNNPDKIKNADKVILPGVGSFKTGIDNLKKNNLDDAINFFLRRGNYILGICLGMQLLMEKSYEFGEHKGLGLIKGEVTKLEKGQHYPVPHIGWSQIIFSNPKVENNFFLKSISKVSYFYFIHSYQVKIANKEEALCYTNYGKNYFSSIINENNIFGTQFHPEKSGRAGEKLLLNFLTN